MSELENSFGFLTRQLKRLHKDLLAFQERTEQRFAKIDGRFDRVDGRLDKMDGRFDRVESGLRRLREDMPGIVGDAVRAAIRPQRTKARKDQE